MGKATIFMIFVWFIVCIMGNITTGESSTISTTTLTVALDEDEDDTITVRSTTGFASTGVIMIEDEEIRYAAITATTFRRTTAIGVTVSPIQRGANNTTATAHVAGVGVRSLESGILNASLDYKIATLTDTSGVLAFVTLPFRLLSLLATFFTLPMTFVGTELVFVTYIWAILSIGMIVSFSMAVIGGRRV